MNSRNLMLACFLFSTLASGANAETVVVRSASPIVLKTVSGHQIILKNEQRVDLNLGYVSALSHPILWSESVRELTLKVGQETVVFRVPAQNYKDGDINVNALASLQQGLISKLKVTGYQSRENAQTIDCTTVTYITVPVTACDSKGSCTTSIASQPVYGSGSQQALVKSENWTEQRISKIISPSGSVILLGSPTQKSQSTVVRDISGCD